MLNSNSLKESFLQYQQNQNDEHRSNSTAHRYSLKQNYKELINKSIESDSETLHRFNELKDKLNYIRLSEHANVASKKNEKMYNLLSPLRQLCFASLIVLAFFERPLWCKQSYSDYCRLSPDGETKIPTSNIKYLSKEIFLPIEILIVILLSYFRFLKHTFLKRKKTKYILYYLVAITFVIVIEDMLKLIITDYPINLSLFLKPIYFVSFNRKLRKTIRIYTNIMQNGIKILVMMAFNIFFFSVLGRIIFYQQREDNYFEQFFESCFNFIVLQTTSNFPDVMMNFYNESRWSPLFFISFLIINLIILTNTILGVFYSSYKKKMEKDTRKFFLKNKEELFRLLIKYTKQNRPGKSSDQIQLMLSDFFREEEISDDFSRHRKTLKNSSQTLVSSDLSEENASSNIKMMVISFLGDIKWKIFTSCLSLFNFAVIYIMVPSFASGDDDLTLWIIINLMITDFFILEQLIHLGIRKKHYLKQDNGTFYAIELIANFIILILVLLVQFKCYEETIKTSMLYIICFFRIARFFLILEYFNSIKNIISSIYNYIPYFVNLFGVLMMMFMFFSALGQHIFGGRMTYTYEETIDEQTGTTHYVLNNFNDTASSIVILFELLIVNNWMVNVKAHEIIMNSKYVRIFFIIWYIVSVLICMNIMVAFIIDNLVNKIDSDQTDEHENSKNDIISENLEEQNYNYIQYHQQKTNNNQSVIQNSKIIDKTNNEYNEVSDKSSQLTDKNIDEIAGQTNNEQEYIKYSINN